MTITIKSHLGMSVLSSGKARLYSSGTPGAAKLTRYPLRLRLPAGGGAFCVPPARQPARVVADGSEHFPSRYARPRRIAVGGMGEIYVAEDETLGRRVAIKLLAERFARDEGVRRRFTREALAAARLSGHPHIVTIFDVG